MFVGLSKQAAASPTDSINTDWRDVLLSCCWDFLSELLPQTKLHKSIKPFDSIPAVNICIYIYFIFFIYFPSPHIHELRVTGFSLKSLSCCTFSVPPSCPAFLLLSQFGFQDASERPPMLQADDLMETPLCKSKKTKKREGINPHESAPEVLATINLLIFVLRRNQKQPLHPVRPCCRVRLRPAGALAAEKVLRHGAAQLAVDMTDRSVF